MGKPLTKKGLEGLLGREATYQTINGIHSRTRTGIIFYSESVQAYGLRPHGEEDQAVFFHAGDSLRVQVSSPKSTGAENKTYILAEDVHP